MTKTASGGFVVLLLGLLLLLGSTVLARPGTAFAGRPNFVIVQTDDQTLASAFARYRTADGRNRPVMPNLLKFLKEGGFNFRNAMAPAPLCAPSRASLFTGQYPHSTGLLGNDSPLGGWNGWQKLPIRNRNLAVALDRSGYRTIHVGKFTNSYRGKRGRGVELRRPPGWDRWTALTHRYHYGPDRTPFYRYRLNDQGRATGPFGSRLTESRNCAFDVFEKRRGRPVCAHFTDRMTWVAGRELKKADRVKRPFFMAVNYTAPHGKTLTGGEVSDPRGGPEPSARHLLSATRTRLPRPSSFNEADISDKPGFIRNSARRLRQGKIRAMKSAYHAYLEGLRGVDDGVGALIGALRRTGRLRNTYFFFTSDNGLMFGEHRFERSKFLPYQEVVRVPLLVRGPGVPVGRQSKELVSLVDVAPTITDLAGTELGYEPDGRSLKPFWRDMTRRTSRPILVEVGVAPSWRRNTPFRGSRAIRIGPWKMTVYRGGATELYNLRADSRELRNLARVPRYSELVEYLRDGLAELSQCSGSECREDFNIPRNLIP